MGRQSETLLERILEAVPGGVVHVGGDGAIHRANEAAQAFLGIGFDELTQRYTVDFAGATYFEDGSPCGVESYPVTLCLMTGEPQGPVTIGVEQPAGHLRWAVFRAIPGPEGSAVVSFLDITEHLEERREREQLRVKLALAERLAAVGTLAAGVAHEINNPLTSIIGNLDLATMKLQGRLPEVQHKISTAQNASLRVAEIVRTLRQFARVDLPEAHDFDVGEAVQTAVTLCVPTIRTMARVVTEAPGDNVRATGHPGKLVQVLVNLLVNAAHAYEGSDSSASSVRVRWWTEDDAVLIAVSDQGQGMPADVLRRARDPFFTTKEPGHGTGLGLSISHSLAEDMGGSLTLDSEQGQGTTATVRLPASSETGPSKAQGTAAESELRALRLLVVDDEADIREICKEALGGRHTVQTASDGVEALAVMEGWLPDLVLCDIAMSGMGGADLYQRVSTLHPELAGRFIFMTGAADFPASRAFLQQHTGPLLLKPFTLAAMYESIKEAWAPRADRRP